MNKFILILSILFAAPSAFAESFYRGPWLEYNIGNKGIDPVWSTCRILPGSAKLEKSTGETVFNETIIGEQELEALIVGSSQASITTLALHMVETKPAHTIHAGVFPEIPSFLLYEDASSISGRTGQQAEELVALATSLCGDTND